MPGMLEAEAYAARRELVADAYPAHRDGLIGRKVTHCALGLASWLAGVRVWAVSYVQHGQGDVSAMIDLAMACLASPCDP